MSALGTYDHCKDCLCSRCKKQGVTCSCCDCEGVPEQEAEYQGYPTSCEDFEERVTEYETQ